MRTTDTATFSTRSYEASVAEMRRRREGVHDAGERVKAETGKLHPNVDILGKRRLSHNSMTREGEIAVLANGIALPVWSAFDGTGSMRENASKAHAAAAEINTILQPLRAMYNIQNSSAVWQDIQDQAAHDLPPVEWSQFESDERQAEQIRLLVPAGDGGDQTEDYDLGLAYALLGIDADIVRYGLKGYGMIVGDQIGRGEVTKEGVKQFLGLDLQGRRVSTKALCEALMPHWHMFYLHVGSGGGGERDFATVWWDGMLGKGRTIPVPEPDLLAETQAGLIYITENDQPTKGGFVEFLTAGGRNKKIGSSEASSIWDWIKAANVPFGEQLKLAKDLTLPKPGDKFAHYRHTWPIGHPRASENVTPDSAAESAAAPAIVSTDIDWSRFRKR